MLQLNYKRLNFFECESVLSTKLIDFNFLLISCCCNIVVGDCLKNTCLSAEINAQRIFVRPSAGRFFFLWVGLAYELLLRIPARLPSSSAPLFYGTPGYLRPYFKIPRRRRPRKCRL